jgi:hypothetical protein
MSTINFAARFEYLSAIETHWPEVLGSLRKKVFPVYLRGSGTSLCKPCTAGTKAEQSRSGRTSQRSCVRFSFKLISVTGLHT